MSVWNGNPAVLLTLWVKTTLAARTTFQTGREVPWHTAVAGLAQLHLATPPQSLSHSLTDNVFFVTKCYILEATATTLPLRLIFY